MNAKTYCKVSGVILIVVGVLGWYWVGIPGILSLNQRLEMALWLVSGVLALWAGTTVTGSKFAVPGARLLGLGYLSLGLIGFIRPVLPYGIHLDVGENLIHLALGACGLWAGFIARPENPVPAG